MIKKLLSLICFVSISVLGLSAQKFETNASFQAIISANQLEGSIAILRTSDNTYFSNDFVWAKKGFIPASTFKIANSIQALENGIVENDSTLFLWDGEPRYLKSWETDLTFRQAFQRSCVPCYQEIARKTGADMMKSTLQRIGYLGMVFDSATVDNFWLQGDSKISQLEQIAFLKKLNEETLPLQKHTYKVMKKIMLIDEKPTYKLFGKTGWAIKGDENIGWFVGYATTENDAYYFATNVRPGLGFNMDNFGRIRAKVTIEALQGVL